MGNSCEVVASNWGPQHQPTVAGRSRRYTRTRPHPEEETRKQTERQKKDTKFINCINRHFLTHCAANMNIKEARCKLRCKFLPERSHRALYGVGGSHFLPHVQLWPWLKENKKDYVLFNGQTTHNAQIVQQTIRCYEWGVICDKGEVAMC